MELREIKQMILGKLHPYYGLGLYMTNKDSVNSANQYKYDILKLWIWPYLSTLQIKSMLPNIDYKDVIELSLYYCPIPESINKFDNYSLCYNSFVQNYNDPLFMFDPKEPIDNDVIYSLCYKFRRPDVLVNMKDKFSGTCPLKFFQSEENKEICQLMCDIIRKREGEQINIPDDEGFFHNLLRIYFRIGCHLSYLLSKEDLLEFIVLISGSYLHYYYNSLNHTEPEYEYFSANINELINSFDQNVVNSLIKKHYPNNKLLTIPNDPVVSAIWNMEKGCPSSSFHYHLYPQFIQQLSKHNQLLYYLTSGNYVNYIRLRNEGVDCVIDKEMILGINNMGTCTFNTDFVIKMNDYMKSIGEGHGLNLDSSILIKDHGLNYLNTFETLIDVFSISKEELIEKISNIVLSYNDN